MNIKRIAFAIAILVSLVAAGPSFAITAGDIEGTGTGYCTNGSVTIYPFKYFTGHISLGSVSGTWTDLSYTGSFSGTVIPLGQGVDSMYGTWHCWVGSDNVTGNFYMRKGNMTTTYNGWYVNPLNGTWTITGPAGWYSPSLQKTISGYVYISSNDD